MKLKKGKEPQAKGYSFQQARKKGNCIRFEASFPTWAFVCFSEKQVAAPSWNLKAMFLLLLSTVRNN